MSLFAKRHYEFIADFIYKLEAIESPENITEKLIKAFAKDNINFKPELFVKRALQQREL